MRPTRDVDVVLTMLRSGARELEPALA
jgi:hypothetical protein